MSERDGQPPRTPAPELESARPARPSSPPPRPSVSNPRLQPVQSAARAQPLAPEERKMTGKRLQEGAVDTLLNSFSILGEVVQDFRNSDRFFKYKAMVISLWFLLAIGSFGVACPSGGGPTNDINAVLVVSGEAASPIYMIKNESTDSWHDVEIIVNGTYRSTMSEMPKEGNATLSSAVLFDDQGKRAPSKLQISDILVKVRDPEAEVTLLCGGAPVK